MVLGDAVSSVCMDFEPYFKAHNLVSVHPKSIILYQMTNLNLIFHVVVSVCQFAEFWNGQFRSRQPKNQANGKKQHFLRKFGS